MMDYEKSCGALVFRKSHGNVELLLIKHLNGAATGHFQRDMLRAVKPKKKLLFAKSKKKPILILLLTTVFVKSLLIHQKKTP